MPRSTTIFACTDCGHSSARWTGRCPGCGEWNTLVEEPDAQVEAGRQTARAGLQGAAA